MTGVQTCALPICANLVAEDFSALATIPGAPANVIAVGEGALKEGYAASFKYIWYALLNLALSRLVFPLTALRPPRYFEVPFMAGRRTSPRSNVSLLTDTFSGSRLRDYALTGKGADEVSRLARTQRC